MSLNKILFITIFLLGLIITGEVFYLFVIKNNSTLVKSSINQSEIGDYSKLFPSPQPDQAIDEANLVSLRTLKKGVVTSAVLNYTMNGIVDEIEYLQKNNRKAINFTIRADNKKNSFLYPDLPHITFQNNKNEKIDMNSIEKGDNLKIDISYDTLNAEYIKIAVIKL